MFLAHRFLRNRVPPSRTLERLGFLPLKRPPEGALHVSTDFPPARPCHEGCSPPGLVVPLDRPSSVGVGCVAWLLQEDLPCTVGRQELARDCFSNGSGRERRQGYGAAVAIRAAVLEGKSTTLGSYSRQHHLDFSRLDCPLGGPSRLPSRGHVPRGLSTLAAEAEQVQLTDSCIKRLHELAAEEKKPVHLRLSVEGGGCSGFQYVFTLDDKRRDGDKIFERDGAVLLMDDITLNFVKGAKVDFSEELIRSSFQVLDNPNSSSSCGCGSSFVAKN